MSESSAQALDLARMTAKMGEVEDEKRGWEVQVAALQEELARCKQEHQAEQAQASSPGLCLQGTYAYAFVALMFVADVCACAWNLC